MEFILFGILVIIAAIYFFFILKGLSESKGQKSQSEILREKYPNSDIYVSIADFSFCVLNYDTEEIVVGLSLQRGGLLNPEMPYERTFPFSAIRKIEIKKNGSTIAGTNRGSQAIGAAVGALAFGGVGAVIGGLSGSTTTTERIRTISLAITVDDREKPIHTITFLNWIYKKGLKADSQMVRPALEAIEEFAARVENAMQSHKNEAQLSHAKRAAGKDSVELIRELWRLKEAGAITHEEFEIEKGRLLRQAASK